MATATKTVPSTGKGKKFHGVPVWVIAVGVGAGGFLLYRWYQSRNAAAATTATTATAPATTPYGGGFGGYGSGGGGTGTGGVTGPATTGTTGISPTGGDTTAVTTPTTTPTTTAAYAGAGGNATGYTPTMPTIAQLRQNISNAANAYYANPNPNTLAALQATRSASEQGGVTAAEVQKLESAASTAAKNPATVSPAGSSAIGVLTPKAKVKKKT